MITNLILALFTVCNQGEMRCPTNDTTGYLVCRDDSWLYYKCPPLQACSAFQCRDVCGGYLSSSIPTVCFFPQKETNQVYMITNSPALFDTQRTLVTVTNDNQTPAPIGQRLGAGGWPSFWGLTCPGGHAGIYYSMQGFWRCTSGGSITIPKINLIVRIHRTQNTQVTTWQTRFSNSIRKITESLPLEVPTAPTVFFTELTYPATSQLDFTGRFNLAEILNVGQSCDEINLNWIVLQIVG